MSYTVQLTNGNILTTVPDTQLVSSYAGLTLIGNQYPGYGTILNNDLVHIVENFASAIAPMNPLYGQIWYDSIGEAINFWNGSAWKSISVITTSSTEPLYPRDGDEWFNGSELFIWNGFQWILIGPPSVINGGKEGFIVANTTVGSANIYYLQLWADEQIMAVVSAEPIPSLGLAGFGTIRSGINFVQNPDATIPIPASGIYNASEISIGLTDQILISPDANNNGNFVINGNTTIVASGSGYSAPAYSELITGAIGGSVYLANLFANNVSINNDLSLENLTVNGELLVAGTSMFDNTVTMEGVLNVLGATTLSDGADVLGTLLVSGNTVLNNASVSNTLSVSGDAIISMANIGIANIGAAYTLPTNHGTIQGAPLVTNNDGTTQWLNNANIMQFSNSGATSTSGYQYLPGGLIMQWGNVSGMTHTEVPINFSVSFATMNYSVVCTSAYAPPATTNAVQVRQISQTQCAVVSDTNNAGQFAYWIAIGF